VIATTENSHDLAPGRTLWIISFLFAGIEAGLLALDPVRLRHRAKSGDRGARRLQEMLKEPDRLLITVLLVT
jgi:Mg2+/Co2+ transporter CorB